MDRKKQRENKKKKKMEARLNNRNEYGFYDPTPFNAIHRIREEQHLRYM